MLRKLVSVFPKFSGFSRGGLGAAFALALLVAGCKADSVLPAPDQGLEYYPLAVNNYWTYSVTDSTWTQATPAQPSSAVQVSSYQFRETISEAFTDAAGQPAYRLVRAKRVPPATAWVNDSIFILSKTSHYVKLNRNNIQTLELVFPVRNDSAWNFNAFSNNSNDSINVKNRRYSRVGQPFTATVGGTAFPYAATLTTSNEGLAQANDSYYIRTYQQVFARNVGPVQRRRRRFANYYSNSASGIVTFVPKAYFYGFSRTETLVDFKLY